MKPLNEVVHRLIELRQTRGIQMTLLAVCPNSDAVLEAAVKSASTNQCPMLLAATLNQVDRDGGYTQWTPDAFVRRTHELAAKYKWSGPIYPCLDHGGPWLKDLHTLHHLTLEETMRELKTSLTAFLQAGYQLLHIDPTVDRSLPTGTPLDISTVVSRTLELIRHAEEERSRLHLPSVTYEVGSEEVHGGLVEMGTFERYLLELKKGLDTASVMNAWPAFIVAQVGTNLHTTTFSPSAAKELFKRVMPFGSLIKGHYTDFVENPEEYPICGMGGANVGPEFTTIEYLALRDLTQKENALIHARSKVSPSGFMSSLEKAVVESGRWKKWLQPDELDRPFGELKKDRRSWLVQTGARYIWTMPYVLSARERLYANLQSVMPDPNGFVVDRICASIDHYINAFNLFDSLEIL